MAELKPCPFCGGQAEVFEDDGAFGVRCSNSICIGNDFKPMYDDEHYASKAWDRRAEDGKY